MIGSHVIKTWAKAQTSIATSSAEAELYALCKMAQESIGLQSLLQDLGVEASIEGYIDSSAALSLVHRQGLGKAKHIHVGHLWIQEAIQQGKLRVGKIWGTDNPSDLLTKGLAAERIVYLMDKLGYIKPNAT